MLGSLVWKPVRKTLGVTAFGINAYTAANAGDEVVEEHTEEQLGHEEIYAVIAGHATSRSTARRSTRRRARSSISTTSRSGGSAIAKEAGHDGARDRRRARTSTRSRRGSTSSRRCRRMRAGDYDTARHDARGGARRDGRRRRPLPARLRRGARGQRASARSPSSSVAVDAARAVPRVRGEGRRLRLDPRRSALPWR